MIKTFIKAVMAGLSISLGAIVYLSLDNAIVGAFLFSIGLFTIYTFGFELFTGKVCCIPKEKPKYLIYVGLVFIGNAFGTVAMGYLFRTTKLINLAEKATIMVDGKLTDSLFSNFIMGLMCGIMMSIAVLGFRNIKDNVGKHIALILPVMVFILAGFEHSIANMFYISFAKAWTLRSLLVIGVVAMANLIGGVLIAWLSIVLDGVEL